MDALVIRKAEHMITQAKKWKELIASGQEDRAMKEILDIAASQPKRVQQSIYLISNKLEKLKQKQLSGRISEDKAQLLLSDINYNLLAIIETLEEPTVAIASSSTKATKEVAAQRWKPWRPYLFLLAIVFAAILWWVLWPSRAKKNDPLPPNKEAWIGEWSQQKETIDREEIGGTIVFSEKNGLIVGTFVNEHKNGLESTGSLLNIELSDDRTQLKGDWRNKELLNQRGHFSFRLQKDRNVFRGIYFNTKDSVRHYWNGIRKE